MPSLARLLIFTGLCGVAIFYLVRHTDLLTHLMPFLNY
jgi:hypothetical protein